MEEIREKLKQIQVLVQEIESLCQGTDEKTYTLEEVRGILADKARLGFTSQIKELLEKYGANKLSELSPEKYGDILRDVKELENGK